MIFIAANDAGGAEVLSEYLIYADVDFKGILSGPAVDIFQKKFGSLCGDGKFLDIQDADYVLLATSAVKNTELDVLRYSKVHKKHTTSIIDGSGNYELRFRRGTEVILPDRIAVESLECKEELIKIFPSINVEIWQDKYQLKFTSLRFVENKKKHILYLSDPISEHARTYFGNPYYYNFNEYEAIELFFKRLDQYGAISKNIILRPHPDESLDKYEYLINLYKQYSIVIDRNTNLIDQVVDAEIVFGCNNNAMRAAHNAGRLVFSIVPSGAVNFKCFSI